MISVKMKRSLRFLLISITVSLGIISSSICESTNLSTANNNKGLYLHKKVYIPKNLPNEAFNEVEIFKTGNSKKPNKPESDRQRILFDSDWHFKIESDLPLSDAIEIIDWKCKTDKQPGGEITNSAANLDVSGSEWKDSKSGDDNMNGAPSYKWFRTTLPNLTGPNRTIHFETVDNKCTIYLNGKQIAQHEGWNDPFDVNLDVAWNINGPNVLALFVGNSPSLHGGITAAVTLGKRIPSKPKMDTFASEFDDSEWRIVHLPHDYVAEGNYTKSAEAAHGYLPMQAAWYRKTFTLPDNAAGKSIWIDFDGVYRNSIVYLNGKKLGQHKSGYTSFRYDITDAVNYGGKNVLTVYADSRRFEGWFYEGGGIYRHVWLNMANKVHLVPCGIYVTSNIPEPKANSANVPAKINIKTKLINTGNTNSKCKIISKISDKTGKVISEITSTIKLIPGKEKEIFQEGIVKNPKLWSIEDPSLYKLHTSIIMNGKTIDAGNTQFGIRTVRFDADNGLFLNGQNVKIQGMCVHNDLAGIGAALTDSLEYWRVKKLKEMGTNAWRVGHCPPSPALLKACDELGMLVMDENRHLGDTYLDHTLSGTPYTDPTDLADMILRDRNHPSIIMWSMCNEEWLQNSQEGAKIIEGMMKTVKQYDTTRLITSAMNGGWFEAGSSTVEDIIGFNYSPNVYDRFHKEHPTLVMFGSETSSTKMTRGIYADDKQQGFISSYSVTRDCWKSIAERPFMAGSFSWTGFDYKGEARWPSILNQSGAIDMCGFPKDSYYYFQSWWVKTPVLHIMPHWNWQGQEGQDIKVVALSNCEKVELFINGKSFGMQEMPRNGHLEWTVKYEPGTLTAKGFNDNALALTENIVTTGAPESIVLKPSRTLLLADGEDIAPIEVDIIDSKGNIVPTASNQIIFRVEGAGNIAGTGNGDPGDHVPEMSSFRDAFNGKCMVLIGAGEKPGDIILTASGQGLKTTTLHLHSVANKQ